MHGRLPLLFVIAIVATALTATSASAATRYAAPTPSGSAVPTVCAQAAPCSIATALNDIYLSVDDEIILLPGTYTVASSLVVTVPVNIHGTGDPAETIIDSSFNGTALFIDSPAIVVSDVEIRSSSYGGASLYAVNGTVNRVVSRNLLGDACGGGRATFRDSICRSLGASGNGLRMNWINADCFAQLKLRNVTLIAYNTDGNGIQLHSGSSCPMTLDGVSVITRGSGTDVLATQDAGGTVVADFESSNYSAVITASGASVTDPTAPGNINQTLAPIFTNVSIGDLSPAALSPTIDAGTTDAFTGTTDINGNPRIQGCAIDIGAHEFASPAPAAPVVSAPAAGASLTTSITASGTAAPRCTVKLAIDGAPTASAPVSASGAWSITTPLALAGGAHTFSVTVKDATGIVGPATEIPFTVPTPDLPITPIDTLAPKLTIKSKPRAKTTSRKAKIVFSASETAAFKCKLDSAAAKACKSPFSAKKLKPGKHKLVITATDAAGNKSATTTVKWKIVKKK